MTYLIFDVSYFPEVFVHHQCSCNLCLFCKALSNVLGCLVQVRVCTEVIQNIELINFIRSWSDCYHHNVHEQNKYGIQIHYLFFRLRYISLSIPHDKNHRSHRGRWTLCERPTLYTVSYFMCFCRKFEITKRNKYSMVLLFHILEILYINFSCCHGDQVVLET